MRQIKKDLPAVTSTLNGVNFTLPAGADLHGSWPIGICKSSLVRALLSQGLPAAAIIAKQMERNPKYDRELLGPQIGYLPQDIELVGSGVWWRKYS